MSLKAPQQLHKSCNTRSSTLSVKCITYICLYMRALNIPHIRWECLKDNKGICLARYEKRSISKTLKLDFWVLKYHSRKENYYKSIYVKQLLIVLCFTLIISTIFKPCDCVEIYVNKWMVCKQISLIYYKCFRWPQALKY